MADKVVIGTGIHSYTIARLIYSTLRREKLLKIVLVLRSCNWNLSTYPP